MTPDVPDTLRAELIGLVKHFAPRDGLHKTAIAPLQLIRTSAPGQRLPAVYDPGVVLVVQGRKHAALDDELIVYDALHYLVVSVTMLPHACVVEASDDQPYLCIRLDVDARELAPLLLEAAPAAAQSAPARGLHVAPVSEPLLDAMLRLMRLLHSPQDAPVLAPLVMREIYWRVLTGALGPQLRALSVAGSHTQRIARAIDLIKRRYAEAVRIEEVAEAAHMSASTLHHYFKQVTSMSPLQYQKQLRLHHARQLMLTDGLDAAVAGHRVGYESPSQFNREYRRLFGAPPRTEIGVMREAPLRSPRTGTALAR